MIQEVSLAKRHKYTHESQYIAYMLYIEVVKGIHVDTKRIPIYTCTETNDKKQPEIHRYLAIKEGSKHRKS
jgi:hypothetical protein